jgi:SM-20-related protein
MLNPDLDIAKLSEEFRQKKRILVRNVFKQECANSLHQSLVAETPWVLRFSQHGKSSEFSREQFENLSPQQRGQLIHDVAHFDFIHKRYVMDVALMSDTAYLTRLKRFIDSNEFLDFTKRVTGLSEIHKAGAMATCFEPGNFLRQHDDYQDGENRLCAYVLNMSKAWRPDWGGMLHFMNYHGDVVDTFVPLYNSMSLFSVPVPHMVSMVSPFAEQARYSVTGWLYPEY